jgi:signal peptidase II
MKYFRYYLIAFFVILIDQFSKIWVHYNMELGALGEINVIGNWFRLHYLLNPGMAFGLELDMLYGKLILTLFRIIASIAIAYSIYSLFKKGVHSLLLVCIALILGGAIGNVIDSIFYGVLFEGNVIPNSPTPWFHGQVIDMLYFPMYEGYLPEWIPNAGGNYFIFFSPVFNIADSSIFVGVLLILIFQNKFNLHQKKLETTDKDNQETTESNISEIENTQYQDNKVDFSESNSENTPEQGVEQNFEQAPEQITDNTIVEEEEKQSQISENQKDN